MVIPGQVHAGVIISELHAAPENTQEWIELYNTGSSPVVLTGWILEDEITTPSVIYSFTDGVIDPYSYRVLYLASTKLNNTGDAVVLKNSFGEILDRVSYKNSRSDMSWSRVTFEISELALSQPSPGFSNLITVSPSPSPSPTPSPSAVPTASPQTQNFDIKNLEITEVLSCPVTGENEWIMLRNNDSVELLLQGWKVIDNASNTRLLATTTLMADESRAITWSGSLLNNQGDNLTLTSPTGLHLTTIDLPDFTGCQIFIISDNKVIENTESSSDTPVVMHESELSSEVPVSATSSASTINSAAPFAPPLQSLTIAKDDHKNGPFTREYVWLTKDATEQEKWAIVSVIMGGSIILLSSTVYCYDLFSSIENTLLP